MEINKYFGPYDRGRQPQLREGQNYSNSYLRNALRVKDAKHLLKIISTYTVTVKYPLIENHSGVGNASVVFAQELGKTLIRLLLIESDAAARQMLENNLTTYGLAGNQNIYRAPDFALVTNSFEGGVGIFIPNLNYTIPIESPDSADPELNQKFLLEWWNKPLFTGVKQPDSLAFLLNKVNKLQLSLFILPAGFPQASVPGFTLSVEKYLNYQIFVAQSEVGQNIALTKGWGERASAEQTSRDKIMALVTKILTAINASANVQGMAPGFIPIDVEEYTSAKWQPIWISAFTYKNYATDNYEALEALGDKILKGSWAMMMKRAYPNITPKEITTSENKYMSERYQPKLAEKMGLDKVARYYINEDFKLNKLQEDLFEAFAGALAEIANNYEGDATGGLRVSQYLYYNFPEVPARSNIQPPESQVKQILEAMWWSYERPPVREHNGSLQMSVRIPPSFDEFLRLHSVVIPNALLGEAHGTDKKAVKTLMFERALETLTRNGITEESMKQLADLYRIKVEKLPNYTKIEQKMGIRGTRILYMFPYITKAASGDGLDDVISLWEVKDQGSNTSNVRTQVAKVYAKWESQKDTSQTILLDIYLQLPAK